MTSKGKPTRVSNGEIDSRVNGFDEQSGKEISKGTLVQRARRERERIFKQTTERRSEQHSPINTSVRLLLIKIILNLSEMEILEPMGETTMLYMFPRRYKE
ncbi:hypothetical protein RHGRI_011321 [Rhododendron griersonianum]|uniref:Uncharacterized protein n=1 Tax=Rhododendron griersonianum TaxID=479676 RepID=A0AAV6KLL8_9ERIC|nr:hypothetical protein RHGRI_011321 [Rhododendron griersonianum]